MSRIVETGVDAGSPEGDHYLTVEDGAGVELKTKGSRFLGQVFAVRSRDEATLHLDSRGKLHHKATHHCWAMRLGPPETLREQADDDGEPTSTAGAPILAALRGSELFDVLLVVTRYFGGTKLGKGGLVRAYGDAARLAIEQAPRRKVWRERSLTISCSWDDVGSVEQVIARMGDGIRRVQRDFAEVPRLQLSVLRSRVVELMKEIREATGGRASALPDSREP